MAFTSTTSLWITLLNGSRTSSLAYLTSLKSTSYARKFSLMNTICKIFYFLLYLVYFFLTNSSFIYFLNKNSRSYIYEIVWMNINLHDEDNFTLEILFFYMKNQWKDIISFSSEFKRFLPLVQKVSSSLLFLPRLCKTNILSMHII